MRFLNVCLSAGGGGAKRLTSQVEFVDMAAAMLHAVECAMAGTEIPETLEREHMKHIRERHRSLLADDAERGTALYELFRADLDACETAVRIAAHAPGIIQLK